MIGYARLDLFMHYVCASTITVIVENFVVWKFSWLPPSTKIMPTKSYVQLIQQ